MKKILIIGSQGQVGWELQRTLAPLGHVTAIDQDVIDLTNETQTREVVRALHPALIVNAAAYTAVDQAESASELAQAINGRAPRILAQEAKRLGAFFIHYSTDYVFDGTSRLPYRENDAPCPLNAYGRTKWEGEQGVLEEGEKFFILRTSWVYGSRGKNFLLTMLKLAKERQSLNIVEDQMGAPTWSRFIAEATAQLALQGLQPDFQKSGLYHLTCGGETSWLNFAQAIFDLYRRARPQFSAPHLTGIPSSAYPTPAKRPMNSLLSNDKLYRQFGIRLPDWKKALELCLEELS